MKRRQITALVLACMLSLSSVTAYADNEAETESVTEMSAEDGNQETESESNEDVETDALLVQESEEIQAEEYEKDTEKESEAMTDNAENESEAIEEETEAAGEDDESESEDIAVGGLEATVEDSETEEAEVVEEESEAVTEDVKSDSETIGEEEAEAAAEDTETESGTVLEEESEAVSEDTETEPETVMEEAETVSRHANMISPRPDSTYYVPMAFGTNQFTLTYPEGVTESDIEVISYSLKCEGTVINSIENLPFVYDLYEYEINEAGFVYEGNYPDCPGTAIDNGFEIEINNGNWLGHLCITLVCKDGSIYTDGVYTEVDSSDDDTVDNSNDPDFGDENYDYDDIDDEDFYSVYLEKGQTAYVYFRELGLCEEKVNRTVYVVGEGFWGRGDEQKSTIDLNVFTLELADSGFEFTGIESGKYPIKLQCNCVDENGNSVHLHWPDIVVIVSEPGHGDYAPGVYEGTGNLIRAFEADVVSKDQNTRPGAETSESQSSVTPNTSSSKVDSPATGDQNAMRIMILIISLLGSMSLVLWSEKRLSGKH